MQVDRERADPGCNPYLGFAVVLAAGLKGIEESYELPAETATNLYELSREELLAEEIVTLPSSLSEALDVMESSELVAEALGEHVFEYFLRNKRRDWEAYQRYVSPFERERYLPLL